MSEVTKRKRVNLVSTVPSQDSVWPCAFILELLLQEGHFIVPAKIEGALPTVQRPLFSYTIVMAELDWHVLRMVECVCTAYHTICFDAVQLSSLSLQLQQNVVCVNSHLVCMCRQNARMLMLVMTQERWFERVPVNGECKMV